MAEASVLMLLSRLAPKIEKVVREEVCFMLNDDKEAQNLSTKLKKIQQVLMDAEQKAVMDHRVRSWLDKLHDISYDIDAVLDEWDLHNLKKELEDDVSESSDHSLLHKVSSFLQSVCLCFRETVERRTIAEEIKKLKGRLDLIAQENENEFKFIPNFIPESQDFKRAVSTSIVDVSEIQGRDDDLKWLINKLLPDIGTVRQKGTQILSIIGMGGMGKTALAQLAFNEERIKHHFEVKIWVCVTHPSNEIKIAKAILEALTGRYPDFSQLETLLQNIKHLIAGKRFLLVFDDVWTEDDTVWKPLKITLINNGAPGSRILVTTRKMKVAEIMGSTQIKKLDPLSDSCCFYILSQIAFHGRNQGDRAMLKGISWEIALKCKGMPLAAKTLGSLLRFKSSLQEWKNVLSSKVWEMDEVRTHIFPFLALSYNQLRPTVKRCFSYCAIFPKGFRINVDDLIRIWMAQGFLSSGGTVGGMELKGREYFEDLAMCCFFQDLKRSQVGDESIQWCKMHDLVHDFAQFLTDNESLIVDNVDMAQTGAWAKNTRHLNLLDFEAKASMDLWPQCQMQELRSFICTRRNIPLNLFSHLKRVKLLYLNHCKSIEIPDEIGNLVHIRYLNLSENLLLKTLPESICDLYNLQTLDLTMCYGLIGLPQGIQKLVNLRHLLVYGTSDRFEFTQGLGKLVNLQTLKAFNCVSGSDNKLGYLKDLNQLGGSIYFHIRDLDDALHNVIEAKKANLKSKSFIQHLSFCCNEGLVGLEVMNALQPSPNLRSLNIRGFYFPNWLTTLTNLRKLHIGWGRNAIDILPCLRNLPFLEDLALEKLNMEHLSLEFFGLSSTTTRKAPSAFPRLKYFSLGFCRRLKEWDDIREEDDTMIVSVLPCLRRLEMEFCRELKALPHRLLQKIKSLLILEIRSCPYLQERYAQGRGEDWDKIAHIPLVYIH